MKRLIASTLFAALTLSASAAGPDNTVPRDTSFTAWSTYLKVRKKHPEVTLAPPSLPKGVKAYENVVYSTLKDTPTATATCTSTYSAPTTTRNIPPC